MPEFGTLLTWRTITSIVRSGIAKPHWNQRNQIGVVELLAFDSDPLSQSIAAGVIPGYSRLVNATTRGLANDQDSRVGTRLKNRTRSKRQVLFALSAAPNLVEEDGQVRHAVRLSLRSKKLTLLYHAKAVPTGYLTRECRKC